MSLWMINLWDFTLTIAEIFFNIPNFLLCFLSAFVAGADIK